MRIIRIPDSGPGETIMFLFIVNLDRNKDVPSLIDCVPDGLFMEEFAGG